MNKVYISSQRSQKNAAMSFSFGQKSNTGVMSAGESSYYDDMTANLWRTKIALFGLLLVSGAVQLVLVAATNTFDLRASTASVLRTSAAADLSGFPALEVTDLSPINVGYVYAASCLFAGMALVLSLFFHSEEADDYNEGGQSSVFWLVQLAGTTPLVLSVAMTAGMSTWSELLTMCVVWANVLFAYLLGWRSRAINGKSMSYLYVALAAISFVVVNVLMYISFGFMTGSTSPLALPGLYVLPLVVFTVFSFVMLLLPLLSRTAMFGDSALMWMYVVGALLVILTSWLAFIVFAADGITYP